jgi:hypothetical protein
MSKQVKFISKSVMGVMTVGVVAMLGADAEAHYVVVNGRCYWHSGECVRKDKDAEDPDLLNPPPIGELVATLKQVEILCPGGNIVVLDKDPGTLVAKKPIVQGDITNVTNVTSLRESKPYAEWAVIVSDTHFLADTRFCSVPPQDVIIRSMSVKLNLYPDGDLSKPAHSSWEAGTCILPAEFKFPQKPPTRGVGYACSGITICHDDNGNGTLDEKECRNQP